MATTLEVSRSPEDLVKESEVVPPAVARTAKFFEDHGLWYLLSRNSPAGNCRDACRRRLRLGHTGIPLHDELKTWLGGYRDLNGIDQDVLIHCRGDRELSLDRLAVLLGAAPNLAEAAAESAIGRSSSNDSEPLFGTISPFTPYQQQGARLRDLVQVFDEEVAHPLGIPGTMMTNAGDVTWAIEFRGQDIIDALGGMVASFSVRDPDPRVEPRLRSVAEPKTIGIITGNAPESGMLLWERINMGVRDALGEDCYGDVSMPRVLVDSLPELGMTMELEYRSRDVWQRLSRTVSRLCEGGADLLTVACNTTPFFSEKIRSLAGHSTQVVMMPEIVRDHVVQQGIREVGLVGIRYVTHEGEWSAYASALQEVEVERPSPRLTAEIERLGYQVKTNGPSSDGLQRLFQLLRREFSSRCIVIALTELSLLLDLPRGRLHTERELIDPLRHYADAIVAFCVRRTDEG